MGKYFIMSAISFIMLILSAIIAAISKHKYFDIEKIITKVYVIILFNAFAFGLFLGMIELSRGVANG